VERVTIEAGGATLTLVRAPAAARGGSTAAQAGTGSDWRLGSATGAQVRPFSVDDLLFALNPLTAQRRVQIDPKSAGLAPPSKTLSLALRGGANTVIEIGAQAPVGGYYARVRGRDAIYLIDASLPSQINVQPSAWLPPKPATPAKK
jgi:hypothetical protein